MQRFTIALQYIAAPPSLFIRFIGTSHARHTEYKYFILIFLFSLRASNLISTLPLFALGIVVKARSPDATKCNWD
jgi:hypothetical protein